jgi:hypothetical protein
MAAYFALVGVPVVGLSRGTAGQTARLRRR